MQSISLNLAARNWRARPLRPTLCAVAIAAAVMLVVCVGAGFDSMKATLNQGIGQMLGHAQLFVRPAFRSNGSRLPPDTLDKIAANPNVARTNGRFETQVALALLPAAANGTQPATAPAAANAALDHWVFAIGSNPADDDYFRPKNRTAGTPLTTAPHTVMIDSSVAKALHAKIGDHVLAGNGVDPPRDEAIVAIIAAPGVDLLQRPTAYFSIDELRAALHVDPGWNVIDIEAKPGAAPELLATALQKTLGPQVAVKAAESGNQRIQADSYGADVVLAMLSTLTALSASLLIATTLSVGVQERIRQYGQLRAIGASSPQLLGILAVESLLLMAVGTTLGIVLGLIASRIAVAHFSNIFSTFHFGAVSLAVAVGTGGLATLFGSAIPAWQVLRVTPMQAIANVSRPPGRAKHVLLSALLGGGLLLLQILLWHFAGPHLRIPLYAIVGVPSIFLGYTLLAPLAITLGERLLHHPIAAALRVQPALLRRAWTRALWRSTGIIAALMIGITIFVAVRQRGASLLESFKFPQELPDLFLFRLPIFPIAGDPVPRLKQQNPSITTATAVGAFYTRLDQPAAQEMPSPLLGRRNHDESTLFVAVDPISFPQMVKMEFLQGDPTSALAAFSAPHSRALLIAQEYQVAHHVNVGGKVSLIGKDGTPVEFTVVGVITSAGVEIAENYFDLRSTVQQQVVTTVLGTHDEANDVFDINSFNIVLANLAPGSDVAAVRRNADRFGWQGASSVEMKHKITSLVTRFVDALSLLGLGAMAIAGIGMTNMVFASVQARRYEFGVLRAIGAGRGQLVRLVIAETLLLALIAAALGALAGSHFSFMTTRIDRVLLGFPSIFVVGPLTIAAAFGFTLLLGLIASYIPAYRGARAAQSHLLAAGRV
jgi:putative ABC transport system permease protein